MRKMKDSGIPWIGEIPKGWKIKKIKYLIKQTKDGIKIGPFGSALSNKTLDNGNYNVYGQANLVNSDFTTTKNTINQSTFNNLSSYEVMPGDICVSMMGTIGKCKVVPYNIHRGIMDSHLIKIRLRDDEMISKFFEYVYDKDNSSVCFTQMQYEKTGSIMDGLNTSIVKRIYLPTPPIPEQQRIADFLDSKCSEIDALIENLKARIEKAKEYKKAVITEAVTKGLDKNAKMKDSGVEWIGEIPENWDVIKIGHTFSLRNEKNFLPEDKVQLLSLYTGIGVFPTGSENTKASGNHAQTVNGYKIVHKNDIVVNIILAWMGSIGVSNYDGVVSPAYDVYTPDLLKIVPHYAHYVFRTDGIAGECLKYGRGIMLMRWRTYSSEFKQIKIPFPSLIEQQEIADYLDTKCSEIDALLENYEDQISTLEEYKKSLIYEYVTGKKEVPVNSFSAY